MAFEKIKKHNKFSIVGVITLIVFSVGVISALLFAPLCPTFNKEITDDNRNYYFQLLDSVFEGSAYQTRVERDAQGNESYIVNINEDTYMVYNVYVHEYREVFDFYYYGVYKDSSFTDPRDTINYEPAVMLLDNIAKKDFTDTKIRSLAITADPVDDSANRFRRVTSTKSSLWTYDAVKDKSTGYYNIKMHIYDVSAGRNADYKNLIQVISAVKKYNQEYEALEK